MLREQIGNVEACASSVGGWYEAMSLNLTVFVNNMKEVS